MANFPNTFAETMTPLPADLGEVGNTAVAELEERGFVVEAGFTPYLAGAVGQMAMQPHIVEFCPKDPTSSRFESEVSAARWVTKDGGRAMFGLAKVLDGGGRRWVGYGWTGAQECDELPDCHTTFAVRLGEEGLRKGLAVPFTKLIVIGSAALYGARDFGLETWESNHAGRKYSEAGFVYRDAKVEAMRPTLEPVGTEINGEVVVYNPEDDRNEVPDVRRYMAYEGELAA